MKPLVFVLAAILALASNAWANDTLPIAGIRHLNSIDGSQARLTLQSRTIRSSDTGLVRICLVVPNQFNAAKGFGTAQKPPILVPPGQVSCVFVAPSHQSLTLYTVGPDSDFRRSMAVSVDLTGQEENVLFIEWIVETID